ncbi:hypothetical protein K504DRAFT_530372 [Pleomassaria siparia CBS 279.74]|uniref:Integral membrane protein n=1 Tax=Pleomassaria siparia CBS 279.74 TaxID=1314801 RepID=A0A6G1KLW3_9PLEO|nr:hypothetical protein K504DRAFT_530372 [Pleomassaria siparia CBS 279.74]
MPLRNCIMNNAYDPMTPLKRNDINAQITVNVTALRTTCITLFALTLASICLRILFAFRKVRYFSLDDYILFLSALVLSIATSILLYTLSVLPTPTPQNDHHPQLLLNYTYAIQTLLWTTIFWIKFSFLAFFWDGVSRGRMGTGLKGYFWTSVGVVGVGWMYMLLSPFVICGGGMCGADADIGPYTALTYIGTFLDILSDVMILTIPTLLLVHVSLLPIRLKVYLAAFSTLSLVKISLSIARSCRINGRSGRLEDAFWVLFCLYAETSVAVLMTSLTAYRTVFAIQPKHTRPRQVVLQPTSTQARHKSSIPASIEDTIKLASEAKTSLVKLPAVSFEKLCYFVKRNGRKERERDIFERCESGFGWLERDDGDGDGVHPDPRYDHVSGIPIYYMQTVASASAERSSSIWKD